MSAKAPSPGQQPAPGRILVVDDEVFIRNAFALYLETQGFEVHAAENGERAIEMIHGGTVAPDVVLLDLMMPGIDGIEVLRVIKRTQPLVEVIIATGCGSMSSAIQALRNGAFDYVTKPVTNLDRDLLRVVEEALESHRQKVAGAGPPTELAGQTDPLKVLAAFNELLHRPKGSHSSALRELEELLGCHLGFRAGAFLRCRPDGRFECTHSWLFPSGALRTVGPRKEGSETGGLASIESLLSPLLRRGVPSLLDASCVAPEVFGIGPSAPLSGTEAWFFPLALGEEDRGGLLGWTATPSNYDKARQERFLGVLATLLGVLFERFRPK